ncbi:MAG TPA: NAD(P)/FAD-dependent oxidoreductase, partial [Acidimicrobiales bacterium]|nr:NAD(P)/FAD-dependent oxidoreductase [Acidimicrobiales bacterium]
MVGGGFGGLQAVRGLRRAAVDITLIDRRNFHLFQPLLYQVATGALSPAEIATPLRSILKRQRNVRVVMGEAREVDLERQTVTLEALEGDEEGVSFPYDTLIVATGSKYAYFGHDEWRPFAVEIKSLESAVEARRRIFTAFEAAELEPDQAVRDAWLTFVVVGGGPTGIETAGQIAELARDTLKRDFHAVDPRAARILLVEAADRVLPTFSPTLSARAQRSLERLGVTMLLRTSVVDITADSVSVVEPTGTTARIAAHTVIWAAGVVASELAETVSGAAGTERDRAGRLLVGPDLTIAGHPEVIVLG